MSSLPKYVQLFKHIRNWPLYFKRRHEKGNPAMYTTKGQLLFITVPSRFYQVFREIFMENFYRINELVKHLPKNPVVVDIGGNVGYFSFLLASKKAQARIYAYEPMEQNVDVFNSNISLNTGLKERISIHKKAVTGNHNGHIDIYFDQVSENSVISSVMKEFSVLNNEVKRVEAISLEKIFSDHNLIHVDLLKVDCEGSEYPIFYDSPPHLFERVQVIALETHELDNETRNTKALAAFLEQKGFITETKEAENQCYYLKAYRKNTALA